ncbi:hypothetical protein P168DRAFT_288619 [Aspergillus campestris IBT 28561]|uniref:Uncharacterized protein n=1 Tax=Aspergillus campestris (strain IBT 28561) TaxID=1392248 RepID=A0A2I1DA03_ASPC2|nr:uncharacterized protein P168DRAFT_288619 [Aspergillus campestris IBT 28561]PKY06705.1 hypothetical protein P168DRAFT_288619 [Aspergillus campestris IBT 28561]
MVALFPVVCAAPLSKEVMDRFIEQNDDVDEDEWCLVFVDSIDNYYDEPSRAPIENDSNPNSPFIGKTPQECHQLLLKLVENTESEIMPSYFAILDERSTRDDTVLLVCAARGLDGEILGWPTVRATFQASAIALMLYHSGHSSVEEDVERAESEPDHVYRGQWSTVK